MKHLKVFSQIINSLSRFLFSFIKEQKKESRLTLKYQNIGRWPQFYSKLRNQSYNYRTNSSSMRKMHD